MTQMQTAPDHYLVKVVEKRGGGTFQMNMTADNEEQVRACADRYGISYPQQPDACEWKPKIEVIPVFN